MRGKQIVIVGGTVPFTAGVPGGDGIVLHTPGTQVDVPGAKGIIPVDNKESEKYLGSSPPRPITLFSTPEEISSSYIPHRIILVPSEDPSIAFLVDVNVGGSTETALLPSEFITPIPYFGIPGTVTESSYTNTIFLSGPKNL